MGSRAGKRSRRSAVITLAVITLLAAVPGQASALEPVAEAEAAAAGWLAAHQRPEGGFGEDVPQRDTPAVIEALAGVDATTALEAASWLATQPCPNNDYLARRAVALAAVRSDPTSDIATLVSAVNGDGGSGLGEEEASDPLDTALVLGALGAGDASADRIRAAVAYLARTAGNDGSWGWSGGGDGSPYVTAHVVRGLARARTTLGTLTPEAAASLAGGGAWLAAEQDADGSFGDGPRDTALCYLALKAADTPFDEAGAVSSLLASQGADGAVDGDIYSTALTLEALKVADVNLTVEALTVEPQQVVQGGVVRLSALVRNSGRNAVKGVALRMAFGELANPSPVLAPDTVVDRLAAGETTQVAIAVDTRDLAGELAVLATIDADDDVLETDEADNTARATLRITPALGAPTPVLPAGGTLITTRTPTLVLEPARGGELGATLDYEVEVDRSPAFDTAAGSSFVVAAPVSGPVVVTVPGSQALADGAWYWRARARELSGPGPWSGAAAFVVDATPPGLVALAVSPMVVSPNGDGRNDTLNVSFKLAEDSAVDAVVLADDGSAVRVLQQGAVSQAGLQTLAWDGMNDEGMPAPDGAYRVRVSASDPAGNATALASSAVAVDTQAPVVPTLSASRAAISPNRDGVADTVVWSWSGSAQTTYTVRVYDTRGTVTRLWQGPAATFTWDGKNAYGYVADDGTCTVGVIAEDPAGNRSTESTQAILVDTRCGLGRLIITPAFAGPGDAVSLTLAITDDSIATATVAGTSHRLVDADGDGLYTADVTAPAARGNYPVTLIARDGLANVKTLTDAAVVVTDRVLTGPEWITDTQTEFRTNQYTYSTVDSVTIDAVPGSAILDSYAWQYKAPIPSGRYNAATCLGPQGRIYVAGGYWSGGAQNEAYDPQADSWQARAPLPTPRFGARSVLAPNGKIYVIGGTVAVGYDAEVAVRTVEAYDPATDTWERDIEHGGTLSSMPTSRGVFGMALGNDGRIYCFGGYTGWLGDGGSTDAVEVYDPATNSWESRAPMPGPQCCFAFVSDDGKVYVLEGERRRNSATDPFQSSLRSVWLYDPRADTWQAKTQSPIARQDPAAAKGADGKIYVLGGVEDERANYAYSPASDSWSKARDLPLNMVEANVAADLLGRVFVLGGVDPGPYGLDRIQTSTICLDTGYAPAGSFRSATKAFGGPASFGEISWDASLPAGTRLTLQTRSSDDSVNWSPWSAEYVSSGALVESPQGKYLQYRANFETTDTMATPRLDRVSIVYNVQPCASTRGDYSVNTPVPSLSWGIPNDPEGDPLNYELQIDAVPAFGSQELRDYTGITKPASGDPYLSVPAKDGLDDGVWYYRVRASDGYAFGPWSNTAKIGVDAHAPGVEVVSVDPAVIAPGARENTTTTLSYAVDETSTVKVEVLGPPGGPYSWVARTFETYNVLAGVGWVSFDGVASNGDFLAGGAYLVKVSARDQFGNQSEPAYDHVSVRHAPGLLERAWASSGATDPAAAVTLHVPTTGMPTSVRAVVGTRTVSLADTDGDATYTARIAETPAGSVLLPSLVAHDSVTDNGANLDGLALHAPGYVGSSAVRIAGQQGFAQGTLEGVEATRPGVLALPPARWRQIDSTLSVAREGVASCQVGSKLYAFGGRLANWSYSSAAEAIDLSTGHRQVLPSMPTTRSYAAAAAGPDGRIYVCGGYGTSGQTLATVEVFDPSTGTWQRIADMPDRTAVANAFMLPGGKLYVIGGWTGQTKFVKVLDTATGAWSTRAAVPKWLLETGTAYVNGRFYLFGGRWGSGGWVRTVQVYEPTTDTWSTAADLPTPAHALSAVADDQGRVWVFGNARGAFSPPLSVCWRYDPVRNTFTERPVSEKPRTGPGLAFLDGRVYAAGGRVANSYVTEAIDRFDTRASGTYTTPVWSKPDGTRWTRFGWTAVLPASADLTAQTRTSPDGLAWSEWIAVPSSGADITGSADKYLQAKLSLSTQDSPAGPIVGDIEAGYEVQASVGPAAPELLAPSDGAAVFSAAPELSWTAVEGDDITYEVQLDRAGGFASPDVREYGRITADGSEGSLLIPAASPLADGRWYWRARSVASDLAGEWSEARAFDVVTNPDLAVTDLAVPAAADEGEIVTVTATVRNDGAPVKSAAMRLADGADPGAAALADDIDLGTLGFGESRQVSFALDTLGRFGSLGVAVIADPYQAIAESDEANNAAAGSVDVRPLRMDLALSVDRATYDASDTVAIAAEVSNFASTGRDAEVVVDVTDSDGVDVAQVTTLAAAGLVPGEVRDVAADWVTLGTYAGAYRARARLMVAGRAVATDEAPFEIAPELALSAGLTCDRIAYPARADVALRARLISESRNHVFEDLRVSVEVEDPAGDVAFTDATTVAVLNTGELKDSGFSWNTGTSAPGMYTATLEARDPSGELLATSEREFAVTSTSESAAGLSGTIAAQPTALHQGDEVSLTFTLANDGNSDLAGLPVSVLVFDPADTSTVIDVPAVIDVAKAGSAEGALTVDTADLPFITDEATHHVLAVLRAVVGSTRYALASTPVRVSPIQVRAALASDAEAYDALSPVALTLTATNETTDKALDGLAWSFTLADPTGEKVSTSSEALGELAFGQTGEATFAWDTARHAPGEYRASCAVTYRGMTVASTESTFTVLSTAQTGTGLTGTLTAPETVRQGETATIDFAVSNGGNADTPALPVLVIVTDPSTGENVRTFQTTVEVPLDGTASGTFALDTDDLARVTDPAGRALAITVAIDVPQGARTLAEGSLTVLPGILVDVSKEVTAIPRVLVWAQTDGARALAADVLSDMDAVSRIVTNQAQLMGALRSELYSTLVMLDTTSPLTGHADAEVEAWVAEGNSLVGSGEALGSNFKNTSVFGVRFTGHTPPGSYPVGVPETACTPAGTITAQGKLHKVQPVSASVLARSGPLPEVTLNTCGQGKALLVGFELSRAAEAERAKALLRKAITALTPTVAPKPGAVVPVTVTLSNRGVPVHLSVVESATAGEIVLAPGATLTSPTSAAWDLTLGDAETRSLTYLIRLPASPGPVELTTSVSYELSGVWQPYTERTLTLEVLP